MRVVDAFEDKDLQEARNLNALFMATLKVVKEQVGRAGSGVG